MCTYSLHEWVYNQLDRFAVGNVYIPLQNFRILATIISLFTSQIPISVASSTEAAPVTSQSGIC